MGAVLCDALHGAPSARVSRARFCESAFSTFLPRYAERYPNVQLKLIESLGTNTLAMLERGDIHVGVSLLDSREADERQFAILPVKPLRLLAACHPSFRCRGRVIELTRTQRRINLLTR